MNNVPQELIEEARKKGIVPGAHIRCASLMDGDNGYVMPVSKWKKNEAGVIVGICLDHSYLYAITNGRWATVIAPAPSPAPEPEGLKEGDSVECGPAMRAAIIELAKELGIKADDHEDSDPVIIYEDSTIDQCFPVYKGIKQLITPEAFIAKMRVTAAQPKPIKIDGHEVKFESGQIRVGCQTIPNATVRAYAEKLKD